MATERKTAVVCLPGILMRCEEQHGPLWLERHIDKVVYHDYASGYDPDAEIDKISETVFGLYVSGYDVMLLGSSLGANVATFVFERMSQEHENIDGWLRVILVDGPAGSRTFTATKSLPPGLITSWFGSVLFSVIGWFILMIGRRGPGLPKDEFITRPSDDVERHMAGRITTSNEDWRDWVKQEAKRCLTGHSARDWAKHLQWMTQICQDGSLDRAARSMRFHDATYIQCTYGNDVVVQPAAQEWWLERIGSRATYRTVKAPHCGYLQMQSEFEKVMAPLMK